MSGKKQLSFTLKFEGPPASFGIMLGYGEPIVAHTDRKKTVLMDPRPIVANYLKEKCSILTDLYEVIISENPAVYLTNLNMDTPIFNLLRHYNKFNLSSDDKFLWFKSALSPVPDRKFFIHQIESCFTANLWHQALLCIEIYLEHSSKIEYNLQLAKQLILEHICSINPSMFTSDPSNYALCILDPTARANAVLQNIHKWSEYSALKALKYCLSDRRIEDYPKVHLALKNKLKEINLYKKVSMKYLCVA